jgi:hypothetical protein
VIHHYNSPGLFLQSRRDVSRFSLKKTASHSIRNDILLDMEYLPLRIWKLKRPKRDDDDDIEYIIGCIIVFAAIVGGYAYHVGF